jgi:type III restriction enzyme
MRTPCNRYWGARSVIALPWAHSAQWCGHASDYARKNGAKAWAYLLIPHDEINESRTLKDFGRFLVKQ